MISNIHQALNNYYNALPNNIGPTVLKSAGYSFALSLVFLNKNEPTNMINHVTKAAVAAVASSIHALMTPVFRYMFGASSKSWGDEFTKSSITAVLASTLAAYATVGKVSLSVFPLFPLISLNTWEAFCKPREPASSSNSIYLSF